MKDREFHRLLASVYRAHDKAVFNTLVSDHISSGQPRILHSLLRKDGQSQKELADTNHLEAATVGKTLTGMERIGYIRRQKNPQDKRTQLVFITQEGKRAYSKAEQMFAKIEALCFAGFTQDDLDRFFASLRMIEVNLRTTGVETCVKSPKPTVRSH